MNILLVTDSYPPEIRSISYMMRELAEELTLRGHRVTIATCWPRYNLSIEARGLKFSARAVENGVRVIRIKTPPHHRVNFIVRGISQLMLPHLFSRKIKKFVKEKIDAVIVYSPPLPLIEVGVAIKKYFSARYLLNIQDIFPQNAIDLGIMKNRLLINFFERMERKAYENADRITSHTKSGRKFLVEKKLIPEEKITTVHNWIDESTFRDVKRTGEYREKYGLKNKFIFLFAGVIGPSQGLDFIIDVAKELKDMPEICFLLVGDGTEKKRLKKMVKEYGLGNVEFRPFVSREEYPLLLKDADVGLISLSSKNRTSVMPGKILGYMLASLPILAFLNRENDGHRLIDEVQCGYSMVSTAPEKAAELIRKIAGEKEEFLRRGQKGRQYAIVHFSKKACIDKLEQLIK